MGADGSDDGLRARARPDARRATPVSGLDALLAEPVGDLHQGAARTRWPTCRSARGRRARAVALGGDLLLPALTLRGDRLRHNLARMRRFCDEHGVALAPHGKTTMAPQLFADQLEAGAWGMTAATVGQAQVMARFGVAPDPDRQRDARPPRDPLAGRADADLYCLVDSVAGVEALERRRPRDEGAGRGRDRRPPRRAREDDDALRVSTRPRARATSRRSGWSVFEGVVERARRGRRAARADGGDRRLVVRRSLHPAAGGGAFFDAAAGLARTGARSSCAAVATSSTITACTRRARRSPTIPFQPALELWADVLSCPEPGRAIAGAGHRDAPSTPASPPSCAPTAAGEPLRARGGDRHRAQRPARVRRGRRAAPRRPPVPRHLPSVRRLRPLAHAARGRPGLHGRAARSGRSSEGGGRHVGEVHARHKRTRRGGGASTGTIGPVRDVDAVGARADSAASCQRFGARASSCSTSRASAPAGGPLAAASWVAIDHAAPRTASRWPRYRKAASGGSPYGSAPVALHVGPFDEAHVHAGIGERVGVGRRAHQIRLHGGAEAIGPAACGDGQDAGQDGVGRARAAPRRPARDGRRAARLASPRADRRPPPRRPRVPKCGRSARRPDVCRGTAARRATSAMSSSTHPVCEGGIADALAEQVEADAVTVVRAMSRRQRALRSCDLPAT